MSRSPAIVSVVAWCQRAAGSLFAARLGQPAADALTQWGSQALLCVFTALLKRGDATDPELSQWIQANLLPVLFPDRAAGGAGMPDPMYAELVHVLLQYLLRGAQ